MNMRLILGALLGAALLSGMALVGPLAREARGDFILLDDQQVTVNTVHSQGSLYDTSRALIVSGGSVSRLYTHDTSTVDISGGSVDDLYAYKTSTVDISGGSVYGVLYANDSSTVDISGGSVYGLYAYNTSTVDISGGSVYDLRVYSGIVDISGGSVTLLHAYDSSTVDISGGSVGVLCAWYSSAVTFHARDFGVDGGLWLDGDRVLGTGLLTGKWSDGTSWVVSIADNEVGATILAIPEPATLSLLAIASAALVRRRRVAPRTDRP